MKLTPLNVYRCALGDCTNGGITAKTDTIYLVDEKFGKETDISKIDPAAIFTFEDYRGHLRLLPFTNTKPKHIGGMFGGNIATLARYRSIPETHPLYGKILHVHDRYETQELNDLLSI
jgi:hypothetical protein